MVNLSVCSGFLGQILWHRVTTTKESVLGYLDLCSLGRRPFVGLSCSIQSFGHSGHCQSTLSDTSYRSFGACLRALSTINALTAVCHRSQTKRPLQRADENQIYLLLVNLLLGLKYPKWVLSFWVGVLVSEECHNKLSSVWQLNTTEIHDLRVLEARGVKVSVGLAPPGGSEGECVPCLSPASSGSIKPWHFLAYRLITPLLPLSSHGFPLVSHLPLVVSYKNFNHRI